ncbi:acyl-CoA thioesterase-1 [Nitrosospira sp. Nsp5]|uniref:Acyl-CoA thioesterase-1 n=1 Tax=Nitrosospira multiformis TaxID=1231 RepID=A0ABY0TAK3_9PROT|nr:MULTISPECIES: arylesterase [Nitrosospira]PTR08430.1 acyl-CoA thioesterase-1 [Nitrosospira sp. Nsp5]SDQ54111.1 acyl-CoA thioesterase-1 [Nitrosospira multiformis]
MKYFLIILYTLFTFISTNSGATAVPGAAATPAGTTIMVFGDSLSAGYGLPQEAGWVSLLKKRLQTQSQIHLINNSISGETAMGGRNRIEQALKIHRPDIVILELGGNDGLRGASIDSIRDNLEAIIEACQRNNATVLLAGMQLPPNYGIAYTQKFQDIYTQLTKRHRLKLVPFLLDGFGDKREFFQADGIHPNGHAQQKIMENVWKVLRTMLKSQPTIADGRP